MKKILIFVLCLLPLFSYGQVYSSIMYFDKFDDLTKEEKVKTLVTQTDSTFVIETKGRTPQIYYIVNYAPYNSMGSKEDVVNLTGNIYGYQDCWCIIKEEDVETYKNEYIKWFNKRKEVQTEEEKVDADGGLTNNLSKYWLFAVHRVITTQYSHTYQTEYFWLQDENSVLLGKDIVRIIYTK